MTEWSERPEATDAQADEAPKRRLLKLNRGDGNATGITARQVRVAAAVGAVVILLVVVWIFFQRSGLQGGDTLERPEVETPALTQTDRQQLYEDFGPWTSSDIVDGVEMPSERDTLVWLQVDGTIESSQWLLPAGSVEWRVVTPPFITNLTVNEGQAALTVNRRVDFHVYAGQAFIFDAQPETTYMVSLETGQILAVDSLIAQSAAIPAAN